MPLFLLFLEGSPSSRSNVAIHQWFPWKLQLLEVPTRKIHVPPSKVSRTVAVWYHPSLLEVWGVFLERVYPKLTLKGKVNSETCTLKESMICVDPHPPSPSPL